MSENSHGYQTSSEVPVEQVTHTDVSNAIDEKLIEQSHVRTANEVEAEQASETRAAEEAELAEKEEAPAEKDEFSSKFAALSRREKELRSRERQIEDRISQFEARMEQLQAQSQPEPVAEEPAELPLEYRLKKDPIKTLEEMGLPYETLTKMVLNDNEMPADMQMRLMREEIERDYQTKFEELEGKLSQKEIAEEEAKYNEVIESFKNDVSGFINENEQYELIQANDAHDLVYDVIEQYYQENGRILETSEAADQVEQYLEEELKKVLEKSKKLGSWKSEAAVQPAQTPARQSPTLSNSLSAQGEPKRSDKLLSREESIAQLASQIRWED